MRGVLNVPVSDLISTRFIWTIDLLKDIRDYTTSDTHAPMLRNKEENGLLNTCNMMKSAADRSKMVYDQTAQDSDTLPPVTSYRK